MWFEQLPRPVARDIGCLQYWATSLVLPVSGGLVSPPARLHRGLLFSVGPVPFGMDSDLAPMAGNLVLHALWSLARAVWRCTCRRAVPIWGAQLRVWRVRVVFEVLHKNIARLRFSLPAWSVPWGERFQPRLSWFVLGSGALSRG